MDAAIQASLEAVMDANVTLDSASLSPAPPVLGAESPAPPAQSAKKARSSSKRQTSPWTKNHSSVVPNSAADFRRREANRLAAERSRSRTSEKYNNLEVAAKSWKAENERLRAQIAELENPNGANIGQFGSDLGEASQDHRNEADEDRNGSSAAGEGNHTTRQEEQEAHSNTILAALTGISEADFSEAANEESWMQDMSALIKQSEASGRLAELAVVATGQKDPSSAEVSQQHQNQHDQTTQPIDPDVLDKVEDRQQHPESAESFKQKLIPSPANNPIIALAAAINTEVERIIMEDLAITKAAIATLEKQIKAQKNGEIPSSDGQENIEASLPSSVSYSDVEELTNYSKAVAAQTDQVKEDLPALHQELIGLRDEKTGHEKGVVELIKEVKALEITDEEDKSAFISGLKGLGTYVEILLSDPRDDYLVYTTGLYSTPAIARRRRGRPPKGDLSRTFYQSFLLKYTPPSRSDRHGSATQLENESSPGAKRKMSRRPRQSKLHREAEKEILQNAALDVTEVEVEKDNDTSQIQVPSQNQNQATQVQDAMTIDTAQPDQGATEEAVKRAEQLILSQLVQDHPDNHQNPEHPNVDVPTSFAEFFPAQEELERHAANLSASNQGDPSSSNPSLAGDVISIVRETQDEHPVPGLGGQVSESALARLKKGPPGSCDICTRTFTTVWRKLVLGNETYRVCNPCGLYHKKFGVIRPSELWDDNNSIRRRRVGPRASTKSKDDEEGTSTGMDNERPRKKAKKGVKQDGDTVREDELTRAILEASNLRPSNNDTPDSTQSASNFQVDNANQEEEGQRNFNMTIMDGLRAIPADFENAHHPSGTGAETQPMHFDITDVDTAEENEGLDDTQESSHLDMMTIDPAQRIQIDDSHGHEQAQGDDLDRVFGM
uniref:GATA-type domain-containing protein n=1 Tax=Kwoniella dejecticola CBS 10117 TaxID=1296121 RepID=A0A1A5ZZ51_9TREE|nr:uncharacterized protein I303_06624 [Kwoniella dejecticola CBS 10117]OBR83065.1 hypothetical protein I303_06624 [Kwoniella dejecticola CBS 10117]